MRFRAMGKKKGGRGSGGGRQYVTSAEDLEARNERHELAAKARAVRRAGSDDEGSDEKEEEEEKEEDSRAFQMQQMREAAVETESAKAPKPKGGERGRALRSFRPTVTTIGRARQARRA